MIIKSLKKAGGFINVVDLRPCIRDDSTLQCHDPSAESPDLPKGQTVGQYFGGTGNAALTVNLYTGGSWTGSDIYLGSLFYASAPAWQEDTIAHELLHAETGDSTEEGLETAIGDTGGESVTQCITDRCP